MNYTRQTKESIINLINHISKLIYTNILGMEEIGQYNPFALSEEVTRLQTELDDSQAEIGTLKVMLENSRKWNNEATSCVDELSITV